MKKYNKLPDQNYIVGEYEEIEINMDNVTVIEHGTRTLNKFDSKRHYEDVERMNECLSKTKNELEYTENAFKGMRNKVALLNKLVIKICENGDLCWREYSKKYNKRFTEEYDYDGISSLQYRIYGGNTFYHGNCDLLGTARAYNVEEGALNHSEYQRYGSYRYETDYTIDVPYLCISIYSDEEIYVIDPKFYEKNTTASEKKA